MRKIKKILLLSIVLGILMTGCGASSQSYDSASPMENSVDQEEMTEEMGQALDMDAEVGFSGDSPQRQTGQKLIYTASMDLEVIDKLGPLIQGIQKFIESHDGYIENMEQYKRGYDPINQEQLEGAYIKIRIPHEHYNKTLQTIAELGNVINKSSRVEDVTLQYSDIESTLKMYKVEQDRLLQMLEHETTDIKDMIEIEKRLSEVRIELEKQESSRRALDSKINYDTIELEMMEVRRESDPSGGKSFASRIQASFMRSVDGVIVFFQNAILTLTYLAIPLIILGIILGAIYIPFSKIRKAKQGKPTPKDENNAD